MEHGEVLARLKKRALDFHHVASREQVYHTALSEAEFLERTNDTIQGAAQNITDDLVDAWLEAFGLPGSLLYDLSDVMYMTTWDTEDGAESLFEQLVELFAQTPFHFTWRFDSSQAALHFAVDSLTWSIACSSLEEEDLWLDPLSYSQLHPRLFAYLESRGWVLDDVTTGDQVALFVLMPKSAVASMKNYLISHLDPRAEWFYEGIPESEKSPDVWSL